MTNTFHCNSVFASNAGELAPVKMMLERVDDRLDVSGDAAELAGGLAGGGGVLRIALQAAQRVRGAPQRAGDILSVAGDTLAAVGVQVDERAQPPVDVPQGVRPPS